MYGSGFLTNPKPFLTQIFHLRKKQEITESLRQVFASNYCSSFARMWGEKHDVGLAIVQNLMIISLFSLPI